MASDRFDQGRTFGDLYLRRATLGIVERRSAAHIPIMPVTQPKVTKAEHSAQASGAAYHGVRLQAVSDHSRFSSKEIKRAVESAIVKNPDVFRHK